MAKHIATLETIEHSAFEITEFCGPAHLGTGGERMCIQLGDHLTLNREGVQFLVEELTRWMSGRVSYTCDNCRDRGVVEDDDGREISCWACSV